MALILDKKKDAAKWAQRANRVSKATHRKYWNSDTGTYLEGRQATLSIAMLADVIPQSLRQDITEQIEYQITTKHNGHLSTGIGGTHHLLSALNKIERPDLTLLIASQTDYPSWGNMLGQGATTFWEQWNGGNSRIHSSFIGIGGWYIETVAGIQCDESHPGYSEVDIKPAIGTQIKWAEAELDSARGLIKSRWLNTPHGFVGVVRLPPNTHGHVHLGDIDLNQLRINGQLASTSHKPMATTLNSNKILRIDSGRYHFMYYANGKSTEPSSQ